MRRTLFGIAVALALLGPTPTAQRPQPYKLGTFERGGPPFVGVVLDERSSSTRAGDGGGPGERRRSARPRT